MHRPHAASVHAHIPGLCLGLPQHPLLASPSSCAACAATTPPQEHGPRPADFPPTLTRKDAAAFVKAAKQRGVAAKLDLVAKGGSPCAAACAPCPHARFQALLLPASTPPCGCRRASESVNVPLLVAALLARIVISPHSRNCPRAPAACAPCRHRGRGGGSQREGAPRAVVRSRQPPPVSATVRLSPLQARAPGQHGPAGRHRTPTRAALPPPAAPFSQARPAPRLQRGGAHPEAVAP